ncbi:uncharacterized protein EV420DRAFT_1647082 [Desarmillaria tabescens]|uniref:Uncharacterized protein n=1 Tax=Armillaria tabescens TaxID=1929756 RepID=A0AA39JUL4_ARMTA|nr:uncharacterized protein EV420DRAFT_1647082 [Desarmillaria tabescens]KAK0449054.1 hypothetical protein EV420DRAFT_1647082 [Desarmillaria tabescens]
MASETDSTPLTGEDAIIVFGVLDSYFNEIIVYALMHGIYTCVFAVTLWNIFSSKTQGGVSRLLMVLVIVLLYVLSTIAFSTLWFFVHFGFIDNGQTASTVFDGLTGFNSQWNVVQTIEGVVGIIAVFISDGAMIWRCWVIWGGRWFIVFIPILLLITETVIKAVQVYHLLHDVLNGDELSKYGSNEWTTMYLSLVLATTLMCTLLIVFRILMVGGVKAGLRTYRGVVEVIVESAALYSVALIIYISFIARDDLRSAYADIITASIKGIAPTLLVGRVAAGHARPNDTWKESRLSSLHFGHGARTQMSTIGGISVTRSVVLPDEESNSGNDCLTKKVLEPEAKAENV